jgi:hypothetical protein
MCTTADIDVTTINITPVRASYCSDKLMVLKSVILIKSHKYVTTSIPVNKYNKIIDITNAETIFKILIITDPNDPIIIPELTIVINEIKTKIKTIENTIY